MSLRVGKVQLQTLVMLGSPTMSMIVPGKAERAMIARGLLKCSATGGFACITPAGLRVLADEMEAGRVDDALERMRKNVEKLKAKDLLK
jgi:F0F1-type ATP synthase epsilon subunit